MGYQSLGWIAGYLRLLRQQVRELLGSKLCAVEAGVAIKHLHDPGSSGPAGR